MKLLTKMSTKRMFEHLTSPPSSGFSLEKYEVQMTSESVWKLELWGAGRTPKRDQHSSSVTAKYCQGRHVSPSKDRSNTQLPGRGDGPAFTITYSTWYSCNDTYIKNIENNQYRTVK